MSDSESIHDRIRAMNDAWLERRFDDLATYFAADAVMVAPGFVQRMSGRDAIVQSYRDFMEQGSVHEFEMDDPHVDSFGHTAVATCPYTIEYSIQGRRWRGSGHDVLVLSQHIGTWHVVWRMLAAGPEQEVPGIEVR